MAVIALGIMVVVLFCILYAIYYFIYSRSINRKLQNQESTAHISMVSTDTMGRVGVMVAAIAIMFILLSEIGRLRSDIEAQSITLGDAIANLEYQNSEFQEEIKNQNSLVNDFSYSFGEINSADNTVEVIFRCMPKTSSENTKLTIMLGDEEIQFEAKGNGIFSATKTLQLFQYIGDTATIILKNDGVTQTAKVQDIFPVVAASEALPRMEFIPGTGTHFKRKKMEIKGSIEANEKMDFFSDCKLILYKNGEKVKEQEISVDDTGFSMEVSADKDDTVVLVLSGVDVYGYTHNQIIHAVCYEGDVLAFDSIYDAQGNLLMGNDFK